MKVKNLSFDRNGEFRKSAFIGGVWYDIVIYRVGRRFKKFIKKVGSEFPICDAWISANQEVGLTLDCF